MIKSSFPAQAAPTPTTTHLMTAANKGLPKSLKGSYGDFKKPSAKTPFPPVL